MASGIQIKGLDKLQKSLKDNVTLNDVKRVVRQNGSDLQTKMQENADFTQGYQTGATKRNIRLEIKDSGFTAEVAPTTEYSPYVNYGTRFMSAQPFVTNAHNAQKEIFKKDMQRLVK